MRPLRHLLVRQVRPRHTYRAIRCVWSHGTRDASWWQGVLLSTYRFSVLLSAFRYPSRT